MPSTLLATLPRGGAASPLRQVNKVPARWNARALSRLTRGRPAIRLGAFSLVRWGRQLIPRAYTLSPWLRWLRDCPRASRRRTSSHRRGASSLPIRGARGWEKVTPSFSTTAHSHAPRPCPQPCPLSSRKAPRVQARDPHTRAELRRYFMASQICTFFTPPACRSRSASRLASGHHHTAAWLPLHPFGVCGASLRSAAYADPASLHSAGFYESNRRLIS